MIEVGRLFEKYRFQVKNNDRYRIEVGRLFKKYQFQLKHDDRSRKIIQKISIPN